jgi:hypothetical protein
MKVWEEVGRCTRWEERDKIGISSKNKYPPIYAQNALSPSFGIVTQMAQS